MRLLFISLFLTFFLSQAKAQFGFAYYQSHLSYAGFNYQIGERWLPEVRMGVNTDFGDFSPEVVANYLFVSKENHKCYAGIGARGNVDQGIVVPVGLIMYPFENKQFGFHSELALIVENRNNIIRGSWGIRYRFNRKDKGSD